MVNAGSIPACAQTRIGKRKFRIGRTASYIKYDV